jgi:hypothetical protein
MPGLSVFRPPPLIGPGSDSSRNWLGGGEHHQEVDRGFQGKAAAALTGFFVIFVNFVAKIESITGLQKTRRAQRK